jgi:hypothetical protein
MNREAIYSAFFTVISGAAGFATASRRLRHWSDVPAAEQPALFMTQKHETAARQRGLPAKWTLAVDLYVYAQASDDGSAPALSLNPLLDALDAAIAPLGRDLAANVQTLGGAVYQAWINGKIETDGGILGHQAVAIIPVEIVVPS